MEEPSECISGVQMTWMGIHITKMKHCFQLHQNGAAPFLPGLSPYNKKTIAITQQTSIGSL